MILRGRPRQRRKGVRFTKVGIESSTSQFGGNRSKGNAGENLHSGHFRLLLLPKKLPNGMPVINNLKMNRLWKLERVKGIEPMIRFVKSPWAFDDPIPISFRNVSQQACIPAIQQIFP